MTARYMPVVDEYGRWAVQDTAQPFKALLPGTRDTTRVAAQAADLCNAIADGASPGRLAELREAREQSRSMAPMLESKTIR